MPFGFGASKASSEQQATASSSSFDVSQSASQSGGLSVGGSQSQQSVAFEDIFARLFGGAEGAAGGLDTSMLTGAANQLFSGGLDFLDNLSGGADTDFLQRRLSGADGLLDEQIGGLGEDIGAFFREQILPGITSEAISGGGLGGGRQGVAEGIAADSAGREFQRGATSLRTADAASRDNIAAILGQNRIQGAEAGIGGLGALAGIADFGFGADLAPFERLSAILGGPTVIGESSSFNTAEDFARAFSSSFGQSQAESQSTGSSESVSISAG